MGPVSRDENIVKNQHVSQMGGLTYYCGNALFNLGVKTTIFGTFGKEEPIWLNAIKANKLICIPAKKTLKFKNVYPRKDSDFRIQYAEIFQNSLTVKDFKNHNFNQYDFVVLGPLFHDNLSISVVKFLRKFKTQIVLAPQGLIRYVEKSRIVWKNPGKVFKYLKYLDYLILDALELKFISQKNSFQNALSCFRRSGLKNLLVTLGKSGSWLILSGKKYKIKAFSPRHLVDPTGAGDSFLAGFLKAQEMFQNPKIQGEFAAMVATLTIEQHGPFQNNIQTVLRRLKYQGVLNRV